MIKELLNALRMHNPQSQMFFITIEIAVRVQELMIVLDAIGGD